MNSKANYIENVMLIFIVSQYGRMKEVKTLKYIFTGDIYDILMIMERLIYLTNILTTN
jgi:hypothetical protein